MHGRLKVRTSDEEKERKKKEQDLKVKAYRAATKKIQEKRSKDEYDDEMLLLTTKILQRNPDVTTLWNIRRQCVERKSTELENDEVACQAIFNLELSFTEQCLMVNPKSYYGWHHRCWSLENCPDANWNRELELCNKYLKMDERNFHTWDYRRYVAEKAGISQAKELDFCTEKIKVNFSNYSSWHQRSLLLPSLYPYTGDAIPKRPMEESKLKEELEMVLTAAFTDPNDSSAWFYQRWLLGSNRLELAVCAFRCDQQKAVLSFTNPTPIDATAKVTIVTDLGKTIVELNNWHTVNNTQLEASWVTTISTDLNLTATCQYYLKVSLAEMNAIKLPLKLYENDNLYYFLPPNLLNTYSDDVLIELKSQLESCESLLEYEPDSKWTLLTSALLMRVINNEKYHEKSLQNLEKLQQIDALRQGYYKDLASKWILERCLMNWINCADMLKQLNLANETQLTSLQYIQYLNIADEIVLSEQLQTIYNNDKLKTFHEIVSK